MTEQRNFTNIGRKTGVPGQNVQHFMSNSPRLGSVQMSQVGTFLDYGNGPLWRWIDGELFLSEHWFSKAMAKERKRLGIPKELKFATKIELGWQMIERVRAQGVQFQAVSCDTLYGRSVWLRRQMAEADILYMAEVPADTQVYLRKPVVGIPKKKPGARRGFTRPRVLSKEKPLEVREVAGQADTVWQRVCVRTVEPGQLNDQFAVRLIWTTHNSEPPVAEWLVMRRHSDSDISYALSNAPADTCLERLAWLKRQRYYIECANQDAKSQAGWDELQAQKYPAWEHHLALTILATWFIAQTKWDWAQQFARDPKLAIQFQTDVLPALSTANVLELLRAAMPLQQLTPEDAAELVVEHLVNRTRSRKSRMKSKHNSAQPP